MLKQFTIDFQEFASHQYLRFDEKFWFTTKNLAIYNYILLKDIFYVINGNSYTEFYTQEKTTIPYIRIGDLSFRYRIEEKDLVYLDEACEINEGKRLKKDDLILATIGATIGKINLAREFEGGTFSNNTIVLRLKDKEKHNPYFYELLFQSKLLQKYIWGVVSQKAQPNLQSYDLENIKIPIISKSIQDQIVAQIEPIEKKIKELKGHITPPQEVINKVFAREFGFNLEKFEASKKEKFFEIDFAKISNYHSLRFDVKNQKYLDVFNDIMKTFGSSFFLKSISKDKGKYGANEPAKDGEKGIDTRYIRITDIDSIGNLRDDDWRTAENIDEQYLLKEDDFLFARSGNTVGKTFLYDSRKHEEAIFAGYFIKFNLDFTNLDKLFFLYYTKSFIYDFWVKGIVRIKGQPNINANEYLELKIPNISLKDQQKIVDEIKAELDKQEEINKKIQTEKNKIDEIIEKAIA